MLPLCVCTSVYFSVCVRVCNCVAHLVGFLRLQLQLLCRLAKRTRIASPAAAAFVIFIVPSLPGISLSRSPSLSTLRSLSYIPLYRWVSLTVCLTLENGFVCGSLVLKLRASLCAAPCCPLSLPTLAPFALHAFPFTFRNDIQRSSTPHLRAALASAATVAVQLQVQLRLLVH